MPLPPGQPIEQIAQALRSAFPNGFVVERSQIADLPDNFVLQVDSIPTSLPDEQIGEIIVLSGTGTMAGTHWNGVSLTGTQTYTMVRGDDQRGGNDNSGFRRGNVESGIAFGTLEGAGWVEDLYHDEDDQSVIFRFSSLVTPPSTITLALPGEGSFPMRTAGNTSWTRGGSNRYQYEGNMSGNAFTRIAQQSFTLNLQLGSGNIRYWHEISLRGERGFPGTQGIQGIPGRDGTGALGVEPLVRQAFTWTPTSFTASPGTQDASTGEIAANDVYTYTVPSTQVGRNLVQIQDAIIAAPQASTGSRNNIFGQIIHKRGSLETILASANSYMRGIPTGNPDPPDFNASEYRICDFLLVGIADLQENDEIIFRLYATSQEATGNSIMQDTDADAHFITLQVLNPTKGEKGDKGDPGNPGEPGSGGLDADAVNALIAAYTIPESQIPAEIARDSELPTPSDDTPINTAPAAAGVSDDYSRADHSHGIDATAGAITEQDLAELLPTPHRVGQATFTAGSLTPPVIGVAGATFPFDSDGVSYNISTIAFNPGTTALAVRIDNAATVTDRFAYNVLQIGNARFRFGSVTPRQTGGHADYTFDATSGLLVAGTQYTAQVYGRPVDASYIPQDGTIGQFLRQDGQWAWVLPSQIAGNRGYYLASGGADGQEVWMRLPVNPDRPTLWDEQNLGNINFTANGAGDIDAGGNTNALRESFSVGDTTFQIRRIIFEVADQNLSITLQNFDDDAYAVLRNGSFVFDSTIYHFSDSTDIDGYTAADITREIEFARVGAHPAAGEHSVKIYDWRFASNRTFGIVSETNYRQWQQAYADRLAANRKLPDPSGFTQSDDGDVPLWNHQMQAWDNGAFGTTDTVAFAYDSDTQTWNANVPDGAVTEPLLADDSVTTDKVADAAITPDKLSNAAIQATHLAAAESIFSGVGTGETFTAGNRRGALRSLGTLADLNDNDQILWEFNLEIEESEVPVGTRFVGEQRTAMVVGFASGETIKESDNTRQPTGLANGILVGTFPMGVPSGGQVTATTGTLSVYIANDGVSDTNNWGYYLEYQNVDSTTSLTVGIPHLRVTGLDAVTGRAILALIGESGNVTASEDTADSDKIMLNYTPPARREYRTVYQTERSSHPPSKGGESAFSTATAIPNFSQVMNPTSNTDAYIIKFSGGNMGSPTPYFHHAIYVARRTANRASPDPNTDSHWGSWQQVGQARTGEPAQADGQLPIVRCVDDPQTTFAVQYQLRWENFAVQANNAGNRQTASNTVTLGTPQGGGSCMEIQQLYEGEY